MCRSRPKIQLASTQCFNFAVSPSPFPHQYQNVKIPISLKSSQALKFPSPSLPFTPKLSIYHTPGLSRSEVYASEYSAL